MRRPPASFVSAWLLAAATTLAFSAAAQEAAPAETATSADADVSELSDEEQAERLLAADDPRAKEGVVVGARGIDPGWKNPWVAERSPNIYGQTGIKRITSAKADKSGYFDLGVHLKTFYLPDFIGAGADENTFAGGTGTFGVSILDIVELGFATRFATNSNSEADAVQFTSGDLIPSIKVGYEFAPVSIGADLRLAFPPEANDVAPDPFNMSAAMTFLTTVDLYSAYDIPFRAHVNVGYVFQAARFTDNEKYYFNDFDQHLQALTQDQWFYDQLTAGVGFEVLLPFVTPYFELWSQTSMWVPDGFGAGGGAYNFFADPHVIASPGVRISAGRGLHFDIGLDIGLLGTAGYLSPSLDQAVNGQPVNPFYAGQFSVSYTFSPFVAQTQVEVREKESPHGYVEGCVTSTKNQKQVDDAIVEFIGTKGPRIAVDDKGCFRSPKLSVGKHAIKVIHPEFKASTVEVAIVNKKTGKSDIGLTPNPRYGQFKGIITNTKDEPVAASVELVGGDDEEHKSDADDGGAFEVKLAPGEYQAIIKAEGYLQQGAAVKVEPNGKTIRNFVLKKVPKKRISLLKKDKIEISSRIPFAYNKARLLRAAEFILDDVVDVILSNPQLTTIRVEGHTDNTGEAKYNKQLSEARANAVMEYLVAKGVGKDRLVAVGYGFDRPLADNDTEEGRAKNRRVEFVIVDDAAGEGGEAAPAEGDSAPATDSTSNDAAAAPSTEAPAADTAGEAEE